jgi:hypothetical protein
MKKERPSGFELLDDSLALLRELPARAWAGYLPCTLVFVWAMLRLWMDSTRVGSHERIVEGALAAAATYIAKQLGECWLARGLWERASGESVSTRWWPAALRQAAWQPWAVPMLPIGFCAAIPFPYLLWFFRNLSANCARGVDRPAAEAWDRARSEQGQSWTFLAAATLAALLVYLNLLVAAVVLPQLVSSFTGFQSAWASPRVLLRTGALHAILVGIVYVLFDSLFTSAAVIRSFSEGSKRTGGDLMALLRRMPAAAVLLAVLLAPAMSAQAVDQAQLDQSIDRVLQRQEFVWRLPPENAPEPPSWLKALDAWFKKVRQAWDWLMDRLDQWFKLRPGGRENTQGTSVAPAGTLRILLVSLAVVALFGVLYVLWRHRSSTAPTEPVAAVPAKVDLRDEGVSADQLPEESWLAMARDLEAAGEYRLALRAIHLAGLRRLAHLDLVSIRRWKSGRDYIAEFARRGRGNAETNSLFRASWRAFDLGWYGLRPVPPGAVADLRQQWEALRVAAK